MAQTNKKRRRKRRGTQGGRVDVNRRAARPRSRAEAQARARQRTSTKRGGPKTDAPPTWASSAVRGVAAAAIFTLLLLVIFHRTLGAALALGAFMLVFYIPAGYYIDTMMWRRRERARMRSRDQ